MIEVIHQDGFLVRSDGTFHAFAGNVILKAERRGIDSVVYPFEGIASTADKDREGEILLQKGLNFQPFMEHGEFNWNHIPFTFVGVPIGKKAWFDDGHWNAEGEVIGGLPIMKTAVGEYTTDNVIFQHNALKKAGHQRGLCMSVEGKVVKRSDCGRYVTKADIYNIALTFRPQNPNCTVKMLAKSMAGNLQIIESDSLYRSLGVQGIRPMVKEDLEGAGNFKEEEDEDDRLKKELVKHLVVSKGMSLNDAKIHVYTFLANKLSKGGHYAN